MDNKLPKIVLISVSKPKEPWVTLLADYEKRLNRATDFKHIVVKERGEGKDDTRKKTSDEIRKHIPENYDVCLLDETGKQVTSAFFAQQLTKTNRPACFIIGSSYGVDQDLKDRAGLILGLSKMVLPHEMARVMLLEQLYRAHAILTNHPYHHS